MKPESILKADLLDILFMNRNKEYGAYVLRKEYNQTINKAFLVTCSVVFVFGLSLYINRHFFSTDMLRPIITEVVQLSSIEPDKIKQPEKVKIQPKKMMATAQNSTVLIVPDNKAQAFTPNEDLNNKQIGTATVSGNGSFGNDSTSNGDSTGFGGSKTIPEKEPEPVIEQTFTRAEIMPEFPGGIEGLKKYLLRNIREPEGLQPGEKIVVLVRFVVDQDGSIDDATIIQSGGQFDHEVLQVVKKMPRWIPGRQNNRSVAVYYTLPVTFVGIED